MRFIEQIASCADLLAWQKARVVNRPLGVVGLQRCSQSWLGLGVLAREEQKEPYTRCNSDIHSAVRRGALQPSAEGAVLTAVLSNMPFTCLKCRRALHRFGISRASGAPAE